MNGLNGLIIKSMLNEVVIIVGHGSSEEGADNTAEVAGLLHAMLHKDCDKDCIRVAYLQFMEPDLKTVIGEAASGGAGKIIVHPFLLSSGYHVTKNIPETINRARQEFPDIEFVYTKPLGRHEKLAEIILERVKAETDLTSWYLERKEV